MCSLQWLMIRRIIPHCVTKQKSPHTRTQNQFTKIKNIKYKNKNVDLKKKTKNPCSKWHRWPYILDGEQLLIVKWPKADAFKSTQRRVCYVYRVQNRPMEAPCIYIRDSFVFYTFEYSSWSTT